MSAPSWPPNVRGGNVLVATVVASIVATAAFVVFTRTLLPGLDLGDTAGYQAAVLWKATTARQAYPLYFGLASPFVALVSAANPARGLNLFSALCGALAAGMLTWLVARVTASLLGGIVAGALLTVSYTFWSQAIIAEVYTLHLALIAAVLIALQRWHERQTWRRLAAVCAVYALAFGNHLSTILLFAPLIVFLAVAHPAPLQFLRPKVMGAGLLIAAIGSLQYVPNLLTAWSDLHAPAGGADRLASFWFDVTKSDWRATMVLGVPAVNHLDRIAMWTWDARQQFGGIGILLALAGAAALWRISRPWAVLVWSAYAVNTVFALTYNVGDTHVFFLPGHLFTAFAAGAGAASVSGAVDRWTALAGGLRVRRSLAAGLGSALLLWVTVRGVETWPAVDRHDDRRADGLVRRTLVGLSERDAVLVSRMNWDQENALQYAGRRWPDAAPWVRLYEVLPHFPYLVRDNFAIGRDVVLTEDAAASIVAAYGAWYPITRDPVPAAPLLSEVVAQIPRGAPYVLTLLTPLREYPLDAADVSVAVQALAGTRPRGDAYEVIAGVAGERAVLHTGAARPFVHDFAIAGDSYRVRMDSWLPTDTFRRGSFGHVLLGRERILFVERGVSLVWLGRDGRPVVSYAGGIFAPRPRFRIGVPTSRLATK
jgi:hypothetical protein